MRLRLLLASATLLFLQGCVAVPTVTRPDLCRPLGTATGAEFDRVLTQRAADLAKN